MHKLTAVHQPRTLDEALALLRQHGAGARALAGGTSVVFSRSAKISQLVDLRQAGLDRVRQEDDGLHVGAMASLTALRTYLESLPPTAALDAASTAGSRILQNHITVGGNCVQIYAWSDLPVALLALGASFVVQGEQTRTLQAHELLAKHPTRVLEQGELVTEVFIPQEPSAGGGSAYIKYTRTDTDHALASAAASLAVAEDGTVARADLAVGAVRSMPQLLEGAAQALVGAAPEQAKLAEVAQQAAQEAKVMADYRATIDYRKQLVAVLLEDALTLALQRATGGAA